MASLMYHAKINTRRSFLWPKTWEKVNLLHQNNKFYVSNSVNYKLLRWNPKWTSFSFPGWYQTSLILIRMLVCGQRKEPLTDSLGRGNTSFERLQAEQIPSKRQDILYMRQMFQPNLPAKKPEQKERYKEKDPSFSETRQKKKDSFLNLFILFYRQ